MRGQAREYANLLGKPSVDDDTMRSLIHLMQAGGGSYGRALEFASAFEGSLPAGKQMGHVRDSQKQDLEDKSLAFANRIGLDAETAGKLVGAIPSAPT